MKRKAKIRAVTPQVAAAEEGIPASTPSETGLVQFTAPRPDRLALLESALEASPDGILIVDQDNNVIASNSRFASMFGMQETGVPGTTTAVARRMSAIVFDSDTFLDQLQTSVEYPDAETVDTIQINDGRTIERLSYPHKVESVVVGCVMTFRDISDQKITEETLRESEARYRLLFDKNPYPVWVFDVETLKFIAVNTEACRKYGFTRREFLSLTLKDIRPEEDVPQLLQYLSSVDPNGEAVRLVRHRKKNGTLMEVAVTAQNIVYAGRAARICLVTDLTDRRRAESALQESESRIRTLLDSMSEGLLQVDEKEKITYVNNSISDITGYSQDELIGMIWSDLLVDESPGFVQAVSERRSQGLSDRYEAKIRKKDGEIIWVIIGGAPILDAKGRVIGSMGVISDITDRKRAEDKLLHDAFHDGLTGLANRSLFMDHLNRTIERSNRHKNPYAVLYLDFDRFKVINDSLGHAEGDRLLKFIARRLENCVRTGDLIARLGGDEFVILLTDMIDTAEALLVAERIQNDLKSSFDLGGREIYTTTSIGITLSTSGHTRAEDMVRDADIAMYYAKARGKAQYQIFDQAMHQHASKQLQIETEMRAGMKNGEFQIHYQPIVSLDTGRLVGFESLMRWEHPERGMVPPDEFIPVAEETGLIMKLGGWAVEESCRQLREWHDQIPAARDLAVSVNLSSREFLQWDLAEKIASTLKMTELDARFLKLEITESHIMENTELAVTVLSQLRALGIQMSLDDFGTGYSSLSYLHRLPVSYLKIDRSFVTRMGSSEENREIVQTIVKLAKNLKMRVVAEGIETMGQLTDLSEMHCEYGQGYLISRPLDAASARQFIASQTIMAEAGPGAWAAEPVVSAT